MARMKRDRYERRDNCGCSGIERRENRGSAPRAAAADDRPGFWDFTPNDLGWAIGAGIVLTIVVIVEAAKKAERDLDARGQGLTR